MASSHFSYRVMRKEEIPAVRELWKITGFQEGTHTLYTFYEIDPEGFQVAVTEKGEIIGACAAVTHHDDLVFLGLYVVKEEYRGRGIGYKLWQECLAHIGTKNGAVNAVPGKTELYRDRGGFPVEELDFKSEMYSSPENVNPKVLLESIPDIEVKAINDQIIDIVTDYDRSLVGYKRVKTVSLTIAEDNSVAFAAIKEGQCIGYGVLKTSNFGYAMTGPLYADNQDIAEVILRRLVESLPNTKGFVMMTISTNTSAQSIAKKLCLPKLLEAPRLYAKYRLNANLSKIICQLNLSFSPF